MTNQIELGEECRAPTQHAGQGVQRVAPDIAFLRLSIVNVVFYGLPFTYNDTWVLIDAGLPTSAHAIRDGAAALFGKDVPPAAIVLTHGHFDHVGSVVALAKDWDVPVFAHPLEKPYLDGSASYPAADPWVGGGLMALMSPLFPVGPIDLGECLQMLPVDGSVPFMDGWRWIHTPGHAPGHISLWREEDRALIAGDAVITTGQESAYQVAVQELEMHGPPRYFTPDWNAAGRSVEWLASLKPELLVSGHGAPLAGDWMRAALETLSRNFAEIAMPDDSRYVREPATVEKGDVYRKL